MIKVHWLVLATTLLLAGSAAANDSPPTDESIRELFTLTDAQNLIAGMKPQIDAMMKASLDKASQQSAATPERQAVLDRMREKMISVVDEGFNWYVLEPMYIRTYQTSFTQDEMDGLIAFYKSPAGRALIVKMPLVMQQLMGEMRGMVQAMQQKFAVIQADTQRELQALPKK